ncbi:drug resistance transporter, EmrB/QacA subfamily [Arboricoccus pini]|uniref:Drug resistance transporter, EmrB/QacA subfamily n=1 Tax=Arboricoccus pini TaxID=1963835 RepID=A0A212RUG8_9PROT|nr:MFS transporter [Arboricoccus pini]SNB76350.1 drug resistance transporter, EmrB/QacA subfamily [Arboricoccus pini]
MRVSSVSAVALLVASTFFMENLDATVIVTALPAMAHSFDVGPVDLNVGISSYILTLAVLIPASGWVADRFGARPVFSAAITIFTLASVLCGLAPNLWSFVAARILQGAGGAMMVPVGRLVVLRSTAKRDLMRAIATITWPGLAAPVLGPPLGGFITSYTSWRWIFFLNLPLGILALLLAFKIVPATVGDRGRPFDLPGFFLTGLACMGVMAGVEMLSHGGNTSWLAPLVLLCGAALVLAAIYHARHRRQPLLDLRAMARMSYRMTILSGSLFRIAIAAIPFLLPLLFQLGYGLSAFHAGQLLLVVFAGNLAMKPMTTPLLKRFSFKQVLVGNGLLVILTTLGCAFVSPLSAPLLTMLLLFVSGLCRSMQFTALNTLAFADVPEGEMSGANAFYNMIQQMGLGMGVAVGALSLRLGGILAGGDGATPTLLDFRLAFFAVAALAVVALFNVRDLHPAAGDAVRPGAR